MITRAFAATVAAFLIWLGAAAPGPAHNLPYSLVDATITLAHSVTLSLAAFDLISLPSKVIETAIAVSIAVMAADNLRARRMAPWHPVVVFAFGLLHGMGFASVLKALGLPAGQKEIALASFNLGIELGQLTVLTLAFAVLGWTIGKPWIGRARSSPPRR